MSIWVALENDTSLYLNGTKHTFNAGDVVVFSGDCLHAGAESASLTTPNFRLFAYVPTRNIDVPWEVKTGMSDAAKKAEVIGVEENKRLHEETLPKSDNFDLELFRSHLYDCSRNKFYKFSTALWLAGLTTNTSETRRYSPYVNGAPDLGEVTGKCPHFDPHDFNANKPEKSVLCNFRRQCVYCQGHKKKRPRIDF